MRVIIPLTDGFEEIEFSTIVDILRRAEIEVTVAGLKEGAIEGAYGVKVIPETTIDKTNAGDFDVIVLPFILFVRAPVLITKAVVLRNQNICLVVS